jgi:hypothetical protein
MGDFLISLFFEIIGFFVEIIIDLRTRRWWRRRDADSDTAEDDSTSEVARAPHQKNPPAGMAGLLNGGTPGERS